MRTASLLAAATAGLLLATLPTDSVAAPDNNGSATIRNGSGSNPQIYIPLTTPCIGETFQAEVDLTGFGWGLVFSFAFPGGSTGFNVPNYGEALVDPLSGDGFFLAIENSNEGYTLLEFEVPDDPDLIGVSFAAQALYNTTSMTPQLTNAIDVVVGS